MKWIFLVLLVPPEKPLKFDKLADRVARRNLRSTTETLIP